jgi:hypothetical protein
MKLTDEEVKLLENQRKAQEKIKSASEKINKILEEEKLTIQVNPNSPIGNPQIIIVAR